MFDAAYTFIFSVLGAYTFYRYYQSQNEKYEQFTWIHIKWGSFCLTLILMVINGAHRVLSEVNMPRHFRNESVM